ncbi:hypothetical protein LTS18_006481 [Coniosporium uncinatum]|uniref:Uncharacterized protein n=1 Tax=Coniosporium uncinatum TaxID=93489 RepID=A0ACC3D3L9_9PEZI|nr:hypothetical protein LTS18_006481 [Coniosporium uncinatum]
MSQSIETIDGLRVQTLANADASTRDRQAVGRWDAYLIHINNRWIVRCLQCTQMGSSFEALSELLKATREQVGMRIRNDWVRKDREVMEHLWG